MGTTALPARPVNESAAVHTWLFRLQRVLSVHSPSRPEPLSDVGWIYSACRRRPDGIDEGARFAGEALEEHRQRDLKQRGSIRVGQTVGLRELVPRTVGSVQLVPTASQNLRLVSPCGGPGAQGNLVSVEEAVHGYQSGGILEAVM